MNTHEINRNNEAHTKLQETAENKFARSENKQYETHIRELQKSRTNTHEIKRNSKKKEEHEVKRNCVKRICTK